LTQANAARGDLPAFQAQHQNTQPETKKPPEGGRFESTKS
jgi:hypothetical protein